MIFILYLIAPPSSVQMKVGKDVVLETSRDDVGQKFTVAGEGFMMVCKKIDFLYASKFTYLFFSIQCRDIEKFLYMYFILLLHTFYS